MDRLPIGCDVYVKNPEAHITACDCILGTVCGIFSVEGGCVRFYSVRIYHPAGHGYMAFSKNQIGERLGTPTSHLSGRPGFLGFEKFKDIAASWGFD